jgi:hypothetical protein
LRAEPAEPYAGRDTHREAGRNSVGTPDELRGVLPQLKSDELLEELQARLDVARSTRDRVQSLLEAVLAVGR